MNNQKIRKTIMVASSVIVFGLVLLISINIINPAFAYNLNPDVSYTVEETSGYNENLTIPEQGNRTIHYIAHITNHGPGPVNVEKAAFYHNIAGWQATDENLKGSLFQMTGKTTYQEGESGDTHFYYNTAQKNCGRVQVDAGFRDPLNGNLVFIGTMINYGVNCVTPTPTLTPTPTPTPTPIPLPITVSISANPSSICIGQSAYLSWTTNNATQVSINQLGTVNLYFGNQSVSPTQTTTYTITATNSIGSSAVASTTVFVTGYCYNPTPTPTNSYLSISKMVRNISSNSNEVKSANVNTSDTVEFVIRVSAPNYQTVNNVRVIDSLPYGLSYIQGSTTVDNSYWSDGIVYGGINLGSFYSGRTATIRFRATVVNQSYNNTTTLTNIVSATGDNVSTVTDNAFVVINNFVQNQTLNIQKFGRNITRGDNSNLTSLTARSCDTIEFDIIVTAPANTNLYNVIVNDILPAGLTYVNNATSLNGNVIANGITGSGINIGSLSSNQRASIRLFATVDTIAPGQSRTMINTSQVRADNLSTINSNQVVVSANEGVVLGALNIKTGASSPFYLSLIVGLFSTLGFYWYKVKIV